MNRLKGVLYDGETRLFREDGSPLSMYSMGGLAEYAVVPATDVFAGGLSPFIATALLAAFGYWAVALYLAGMALITIAAD